MKKLNLSKVFTRNYSVYLVIMMFVLICWFLIFAQVITVLGRNYIGDENNSSKAIEYHGKFLILQFENADRAIFALVIFTAFIMIIIGISGIGTYLYSKITVKTLITSLSYLKVMIDNIHKEEYEFSEYQEKIAEFDDIENAFRAMVKKINYEKEKIRRSDEVRKKLILDISHDLKNPLMSIDGYIELLLDDTKSDNNEKYLKIISENSKRANRMIMDLFELAKLESADFIMKLNKIDLVEIVRNVLIERLDELTCNEISIDFITQDNEIMIMGNETELCRAMSNVIDNVMKYHKKNTILKVICEQHGNKAYLKFSNASALKLENTDKLLERFVRLEDSEKFNSQGAGIGLSIVSKIVEAHKGKANCSSDQDGEFNISIELPKQ